MITYTTSKSLTGTISVTNTEGDAQAAASLYGMKSEMGEMSINRNIVNKDLYHQHKEQIDKETEEFTELVRSMEI